jgi:ubiquinone/menaquinone biosynthesis C-methylase UbiE
VNDWRSYDDVAETYERVHAPRHREVAADLLALIGVAPGDRVLDVGTGTGVAAEVAAGGDARAVGVDRSVSMLATGLSARPGLRLVAAEAIDLPFRDGAFDAAVANFVIHHFPKPKTALFDVVRVLRSGGRLAVSTWAATADAYEDAWRELVETVVPREVLRSAVEQAAPGRDRFQSPQGVEDTLKEAGLRQIRVERRQYRWTYRLDEYLDGLSTPATGRFVREMLGERGWMSFTERARTVFAGRFPDPLNDFQDVILAVGAKS